MTERLSTPMCTLIWRTDQAGQVHSSDSCRKGKGGYTPRPARPLSPTSPSWMEHLCPHTAPLVLIRPFCGDEFLVWEVTLTAVMPSLCPIQSLQEVFLSSLCTNGPEPHSLPWHWNPLAFRSPCKGRRRHVRQPRAQPTDDSHIEVTFPCPSGPGATPSHRRVPRVFRLSGEGEGRSSAVTSISPQKAEDRRLRPPGGGVGEHFRH